MIPRIIHSLTHKDHSIEPAFICRGQVKITLRRRQHERYGQHFNSITWHCPATQCHQQYMELPIPCYTSTDMSLITINITDYVMMTLLHFKQCNITLLLINTLLFGLSKLIFNKLFRPETWWHSMSRDIARVQYSCMTGLCTFYYLKGSWSIPPPPPPTMEIHPPTPQFFNNKYKTFRLLKIPFLEMMCLPRHTVPIKSHASDKTLHYIIFVTFTLSEAFGKP